MHMHKLMYTHTLLPAKNTLTNVYTHTYAHSYTLTVLICMNAGMCRNEDGWGTVTPCTTVPVWLLQIVQKKQESRHQKPGSYPTALLFAELCWLQKP